MCALLDTQSYRKVEVLGGMCPWCGLGMGKQPWEEGAAYFE